MARKPDDPKRTKFLTTLSTEALAALALAAGTGASVAQAAPVDTSAKSVVFSAAAKKPERGPRLRFDVAPGEQQRILSGLGLRVNNDGAFDGIFVESTHAAVREYQALSQRPSADALSRAEAKEIRRIVKLAAVDAYKLKLKKFEAVPLRLAAELSGAAHKPLVERYKRTKGHITATHPAIQDDQLFKFGASDWLYLVKTYGPRYGLGDAAGKIIAEEHDGMAALAVRDISDLKYILALRDNPRLSALMAAEFIRENDKIPLTTYAGFESLRSERGILLLQESLLSLGFDLGIRQADGAKTPLLSAALDEYQAIYKRTFSPVALVEQLQQDVAQAERDSAMFSNRWHKISPAEAFAIRHAARTVGPDFGYLMELAAAESGFDPEARPDTSTARGLYQFTEDTWLQTLKTNGAKYGLGALAAKIHQDTNAYGAPVWRIDDPFLRDYALSLRENPHVAALMGAELVKQNKAELQARLAHNKSKHKITRTDEYLTHFMGIDQALRFLTRLKRTPEADAAAAFPSAASANAQVFYDEDGAARSFKEVYGHFSRKFNVGFFDRAPPKPGS